jgi:hypothetical protein
MPVAVNETGSHRVWCSADDTVDMWCGLAGPVVFESYTTAENRLYVVLDMVQILVTSAGGHRALSGDQRTATQSFDPLARTGLTFSCHATSERETHHLHQLRKIQKLFKPRK